MAKTLSFGIGTTVSAIPLDEAGRAYRIRYQGKDYGYVTDSTKGDEWAAISLNHRPLPSEGGFKSRRQAALAVLRFAGVIK